ncbi:Uncharacterised protein [Mycobacteroides abscessus]|nr:Uncharacterised protein [Mycobacteroides abscessus]CQA11531.1 Uncharacterised protein [Mycobacteroides abscessus]SIN19811.1 Uncharacterised protein [Mycobacteroides abscessus subsp. abscessus]
MTLWEPEISKGIQLFVNTVGLFTSDAMQILHTLVKPGTQALHALWGPFGTHGAAQLIGFSRSETGYVNGQLHQLFLKQRDPESLLQRPLHGRMLVFPVCVDPVVPPDIWMYGAALDRSGTNERDLHH